AGSAAVALAVGAALMVHGGIGANVGGGDLHGMFLPRYEYAARAARAGSLALWNPYEFCGMPMLGTAQGGVLYPPVLVLFNLSWWTALQLFFVFHVFVLAWGMQV